jgi:hypothetical protein
MAITVLCLGEAANIEAYGTYNKHRLNRYLWEPVAHIDCKAPDCDNVKELTKLQPSITEGYPRNVPFLERLVFTPLSSGQKRLTRYDQEIENENQLYSSFALEQKTECWSVEGYISPWSFSWKEFGAKRSNLTCELHLPQIL